MILLFSTILGCTNQIELVYTTEPCEDWDFSNESPELRITDEGDDVVIRRVGIDGYCGDQFQPQIFADGWDLRVVESWDSTPSVTECESCLTGRVTMLSPPSGDYHLDWYDNENAMTPVHDEYFIVE
jgi:hypothetical protein